MIEQGPFIVSRSIRLVSLCVGLSASSAFASDFTIRSTQSETVEFNDNRNLRTGPSSGVIGSYSSFGTNAVYRTAATRFTLGGNFTYRKYFGSASEIGTFSETKNNGVNLGYETTGRSPGDKNFVTASYQRADAALTQRDESGVSTVRGDAIIYSVSGGQARVLDRRNSVNWSTSYSTTTYSPSGSGATPLTNIGTSAGWTHRADARTDLTTSTSLGWLIYDNASETKTTFWRTMTGGRSRITPRLSVTANVGVTVFNTTRNSTAVTVTPPADPLLGPIVNVAPTSTGSSINPSYDLSLSYRLFKLTDLSLSHSFSTSPGTLGDIATRTSYSVNLSHRLSARSSLAVAGTLSKSSASAGLTASELYSATLLYRYQLSRDWLATASYIYRLRNTASGSADSNDVIFVVSRDFTLKP